METLELRVGDDRIHCLRAGSGTPVLMLHGGACDSRDWIETMTSLSSCCTCYAPDLIGYGLSDNNRDGYYLSDFVDSTVGLIETLGLSQVVIAGHSLGGRIGLEIALRRPGIARKLVLVNTAGFSRLARLGNLIAVAAWAVRTIRRQPQPYPKLLKEDDGHADWVCLDELTSLTVPTLVVWSRRDLYYPLAGAVKAARLIPRACLRVLPCYGHAPHRQRREMFNRLLLSFVNHDSCMDDSAAFVDT